MGKKKYILDQVVAEKKLRRMAFEIIENNPDENEIILAGIRESGSVVAKCIQQLLKEIGGIKTHLISISLDKRMPSGIELSEQIDFNDKVIIIKDGNDRYSKFPKDSYSFSKREMESQIQKINQEYDFKIQMVKNKFSMSRWQKKSQISLLDNQRQMEISKVVARFKHAKNRDYGYGNDSRKNW